MSTARRWRLFSGGCFVFVIFGSALVILIVLLLIRAPSYLYEPEEIREFLIWGALICNASHLDSSAGIYDLSTWPAVCCFSRCDNAPRCESIISYPNFGKETSASRYCDSINQGGVLGVLVVGVIFANSDLIGPRVDFSQFELINPSIHYLWYVAAAVFVPHWLVGPFLRIRYSAALGAFAGTWASARRDRLALGLTARLAFGLVGVLIGIWGITLMTMIHRAMSGASYARGYVDYSGAPVTAQLVLWGVPIFALGQILLPYVYLRLARISRATQESDQSRKSFVAWAQKNTATRVPSGSE